MLCLVTYLNIKTMKIGLDALLRMRKGKMNNFLMQHLFRFQTSLNWMLHQNPNLGQEKTK